MSKEHNAIPTLERRPLVSGTYSNIWDTEGNIVENPTHALFNADINQMVSPDFYNNGRYIYDGVEHLEPLEVIGLAPKQSVPWYNNDMFGHLIGDLRVNTVSNVLAKNPHALDNWDMANNTMEFASTASAGLLNRLSPSLNIGLLTDGYENYLWNLLSDLEKHNMQSWWAMSPEDRLIYKKYLVPERYQNNLLFLPFPHNFMESWFDNSGFVPENYSLEHPYKSMIANGVVDLVSYSLPHIKKVGLGKGYPRNVEISDKRAAVQRMLDYFSSPEYALRIKETNIPYSQDEIVDALNSRINNIGFFPAKWVKDIKTGTASDNYGKTLGRNSPLKGIQLNNKYRSKIDLPTVLDHELAHYSTFGVDPLELNDKLLALLYPKQVSMWDRIMRHNGILFSKARTDEQILKDFGVVGEEAQKEFLRKIDPDYLRETLEIRARLYAMDLKARSMGLTMDELVDAYTYDGFINNTPNDLTLLLLLGYLFTPELIKDLSKKFLTVSAPLLEGASMLGNTNSKEESTTYKLGGQLNIYSGLDIQVPNLKMLISNS